MLLGLDWSKKSKKEWEQGEERKGYFKQMGLQSYEVRKEAMCMQRKRTEDAREEQEEE